MVTDDTNRRQNPSQCGQGKGELETDPDRGLRKYRTPILKDDTIEGERDVVTARKRRSFWLAG
mgnify:CR=1 FL=1|tara:strand:+ start:4688 stop:4876 length:189 start_codon:yes stop_codon:yes gene_type:complete